MGACDHAGNGTIEKMKPLNKIAWPNYRLGVLAAVVFFAFWQILPSTLFDDPYSFVVTSREGKLLGATIASDGQWRFPIIDEVPPAFEQSILTFEDKRFYRHPGMDVVALARAFYQNVKAGRVKSGGSTLTMQTIRLMRKNRPRTIWEKLREIFLALRLEMRYDKADILRLYASHAPFGGNVVGLETASWRYYEKPPQRLSPAESACLAVLPNSPSLVRPGKNQSVFLEKRNRLLRKLGENGVIAEADVTLYETEPLPGRPHGLPQLAPHLLQRARAAATIEHRLHATIDFGYQEQLNKILANHHKRLRENGVHNAAALITDISTGEVLAYTGNVAGIDERHSPSVDIINAPRSSGSVLKPILYAAMLQKGEVLPSQLIPDVPTYFGNFHPKNYTERYLGAVKARAAMALSLNVPAVLMLNEHGVPVFHHELNRLGMSTLDRSPGHYGLSLILGGAEVTPWDLSQMYGTFAGTLKRFNENGTSDTNGPFVQSYRMNPPGKADETRQTQWDAGAIYQALEAMVDVRRPEAEAAWRHYSSSQTIAWKTGTSFGSRDAWAVGLTPRFVVTVWAGNADGEGRSGVSGLQSAAPVLFDIFSFLPKSNWFREPHEALYDAEICTKSGYRAGNSCAPTHLEKVTRGGTRTKTCPFHQRILLTSEGSQRVYKECYKGRAVDTTWFRLPSEMAWYYKQWHPMYADVPLWHPACQGTASRADISILYPRPQSRIKIPMELDGARGKLIAEATAGQDGALYWHLDHSYIGKTLPPHQMAMAPVPGQHRLIVEDPSGHRKAVSFEVIEDGGL